MIKVYVDDSGKPDSSPSLILAGFSASEAVWTQFTNDWCEMLKRQGLSSFHMSDIWSMQPKSGLKSSIKQSVVLVEAVEIVKRHLFHAFAVSVPFDAHHHWFATKDNPDLRPLRTYPFAFHSLLALICKHSWTYQCNQPLKVVFEQQGDESPTSTLSVMEEFRRLNAIHFPGLEMLDPEFIAGKQCAPLQAADLLSWLVRRDATNSYKRVDRNLAAESLLLGEILYVGHTIKIWTESDLERAASQTARNLFEQASS